MEHESLFKEAIEACNKCIKEDDRTLLWPKVLRIEENGLKTIMELDGNECRFKGGTDDESLGNAHALFRLMFDESRICALYAYRVEVGIKPVDIIVGFLDKENNLTLAWDNKSVYPSIGNVRYNATIPEKTKWIVAAAFRHQYRHAISLFAQCTDQSTLKSVAFETLN